MEWIRVLHMNCMKHVLMKKQPLESLRIDQILRDNIMQLLGTLHVFLSNKKIYERINFSVALNP